MIRSWNEHGSSTPRLRTGSYRSWFGPFPDGTFAYGPDGAFDTQLFFYQALEPSDYSQHGTGLQHIAFAVSSRAIVREVHAWAVSKGAEILNEPREFPEYGAHYATYWLDPHGLKLDAVCAFPEAE
jgi:catechol 2,3-dioxygenase-like lactoylglutathione lyase family enzyme